MSAAQLELTYADHAALTRLGDLVVDCLRRNAPRAMTYQEIHDEIGKGSLTGISARIRERRQAGEPISDAMKRKGEARVFEFRWEGEA
jgi:hypothetical protein